MRKGQKMIRKKFFCILSLAFLLFMIGDLHIAQAKHEEKAEKPEVISLLGKKLYATPAEGEELLKLQKDLEEASKNFNTDPDNPEYIIMYGRRLAYLWRYHDAIEVYTKGIEKFPNNAMLYRHRGHRYISIRTFDKAVEDLAKAAELNDHDFDIWYHLGLAQYLRGQFDKALDAYKECYKVSDDDDAKIAISNWLYITLRRLEKKDEAEKALNTITEGMNVVENQSYYDLLLFYKGRKTEAEIKELAEASELDRATIGYGLACWYLYNNDKDKARDYFEKIVDNNKYWPAFGFISAEAELARMKK
jgi:tetratricopeptide (TPR) repeat protein